MKTKLHHLLLTLALLVGATLNLQLSTAFAQGTAFTYQGQLINNTNPVKGTYDFTFSLFNVSSGGGAVAGPVTNAAVGVTNGLFTVTMDFGAGVFNGTTYWLQIGVRTNGGGAFTTLTPRQQLTPTPYAIFAEGANAAGLSGTIPTGDLSGIYGSAVTLNNAGNSFTGNGSGLTGLNASQLTSGTVPNARLAADVALTDANQTFTGTNTFSTGTGNGRLTVSGYNGIDTSLFTGLGFQYYAGAGEGAIMSSYNDGYGSLGFYTKHGGGFPILKQMQIDFYGGVAIDLQNANSGRLNDSTTNGVALTFGTGSGEGIASQRTTGLNQYGLDFYTGYAHRMSILQGGNVGIGTTNPASKLEVNGDVRIDGNRFLLEPATAGNFASDGLIYGDFGLPGINYLGPCLFGFDGGALGAYSPNTVALSWDASGDCWVSNNLSTASMTVRGNGLSTPLTVSGEFAVVYGLGNEQAYMGGDGVGGDVQFGSLNSAIDNVAFYNAGKSTYMHIYCSSITIEGGADLAEPFMITSGKDEIPQGAVVVIDKQNPGQLKMSDQPYDRHVAGVVSGANGINPGIQMQQQGLLAGGKNVALTGRVYVLADTSNGPIESGDLLTSSSAPGHAMKVTDNARAQGAILGKAMTGLSEGKGLVLVLVTLQ
jgi:hypothetical protein